MIRNAWHMAGGEGQAANSSNLRVLVTHPDGRQVGAREGVGGWERIRQSLIMMGNCLLCQWSHCVVFGICRVLRP